MIASTHILSSQKVFTSDCLKKETSKDGLRFFFKTPLTWPVTCIHRTHPPRGAEGFGNPYAYRFKGGRRLAADHWSSDGAGPYLRGSLGIVRSPGSFVLTYQMIFAVLSLMESPVAIRCKFDEIVPIGDLKPHPKNRNQHPKSQIERLSKILIYQGQRAPIIVSRLSGHIVKGHGTAQALELAGCDNAAVVYQDFESKDQEYAFIQSDNAIAEWATLDLSGINLDLSDLGPDLDIDMLGLKNFRLDPFEKNNPHDEWKGMPEFEHEDQTSKHRVIVHFATTEHLRKFAGLIGQSLTESTRSIWFPPAEIGRIADKEYVSDEPSEESVE